MIARLRAFVLGLAAVAVAGIRHHARAGRALGSWALELLGLAGLAGALWFSLDPWAGVTLISIYAIGIGNRPGKG